MTPLDLEALILLHYDHSQLSPCISSVHVRRSGLSPSRQGLFFRRFQDPAFLQPGGQSRAAFTGVFCGERMNAFDGH